MPHIHTLPGQVDAVVTGYVLRSTDEDTKVLLHRHKKFNMLLGFGGHIELDETPWAAMAHELYEESGYSINELLVLQPKLRMPLLPGIVVHPQPLFMNTHELAFPKDHFHSDTVYAFVAKDEPGKQPDEGESQHLAWYTRDQITALPPDEIWDNTRAAVLAIFDTFLQQWESVPAADFSINKNC